MTDIKTKCSEVSLTFTQFVVKLIAIKMYSIDELSELSAEELYQLVNKLQRRVDCLTTDLLRFKSHFKLFYKYFDEIDENSETIDGLNDLIKQIKAVIDVNDNDLLVSVKKLTIDSKSKPIFNY